MAKRQTHNTKVIATHLFPKSKFAAITLFGIVFTRDKKNITPRLLNHERIHCRQQLEWLYLPFYIMYTAEWLLNLIRFRNFDKAYRAISFEREAYEHDRDLHYLDNRKCYSNYRKTRKSPSYNQQD